MSQRNENDAYYTPPALTRVLLDRLDSGAWHPKVEDEETGEVSRKRVVAEPCAGDNWIADEVAARGYQVVTGDRDQSKPVHYPGTDFFGRKAERVYGAADIVITNPPFSGAPLYVRRALEMADSVAMLLRLTFLEPCESKPRSARADLLKDLTRVIVLPRVSFYQGDSGTDSATCAWFVWTPARCGSASLEIVTERELAEAAGQETLFGGDS